MTYDPPTYWTVRGLSLEGEARGRGWAEAVNEPFMDLLATLRFRSVLEVGCGFGRVTAAIRERWPTVRCTGMDVSPDMIASARARMPDVEWIVADLVTFEDPRKFDLVVADSVLGHLLPSDIEAVVAKLRRLARRDLVTIDWNMVGGQTAYQFGHDYRALYGPAAVSTPLGATSMWHVRV